MLRHVIFLNTTERVDCKLDDAQADDELNDRSVPNCNNVGYTICWYEFLSQIKTEQIQVIELKRRNCHGRIIVERRWDLTDPVHERDFKAALLKHKEQHHITGQLTTP